MATLPALDKQAQSKPGMTRNAGAPQGMMDGQGGLWYGATLC